ncbi:serine/threonine-protein kinase [Ahniella affigens]|nr:serine/threonine-protein kinase [Ahniella affigens]
MPNRAQADLKATVTGMFAVAEFSPGTVIAERFRIVRLLGMGAMGVVYQAEDEQLKVPVALKLLRPELANKAEAFERFRHELLLARQVSNPHVVRIHDLVQHQGLWLISMDFVRGESLEDLLLRERVLLPERALLITRQLALGLQAAHQKQVVHRDLKPANVLINEHGDALITDFGVARSIGETRLTQSGIVIGTPAYLSPEQAQAAPIDGRSDLYTLGLMLYEMLSGELPFASGTGSEVLVQRILRSPPSILTVKPELPSWLADLLAALLTPKPEQRLPNAEALIAAIDQRRARAPKIDDLGAAPSARWPWLTAIAAVAAVGLAAALFWRGDQRAPDPDNAPWATLTLMPVHDNARPGANTPDLRDLNRVVESDWIDRGLKTISVEQINRALVRLGFDQASWHRHRDEVFAALPSQYFLELDIDEDQGQRVWVAQLWPAGAKEPSWTERLAEATNHPDQTALKLIAAAEAELPDRPKTAPAPNLLERLQQLARLSARAPGAEAVAATDAVAIALDCSEHLNQLEQIGERAEASRTARECLDRLPKTAITATVQRARAHASLALDDADAALPNLPATGWLSPEAQRLRARALADQGELEAAQAAVQLVLKADPGNGRAWFESGKYAIMAGDAQRAVDDYLVRAQVLANRLQDAALKGDVANAQGIGYRRLGQLEASADAYRQAAGFHAAAGNRRGQATSLHNLSATLSLLGQFDAAEQSLHQAEEILTPMGDQKALADLRNDFGLLAEERGDYPAALAAHREALSMRMQSADQRAVAESLLNVGFAYYQMGDFANAELHWQQANERFLHDQDLFGQVRAQQGLGLAFAARGRFAEARAAFEYTLNMAETNQMSEELAVAHAALAEQDRLEGKLESARTHMLAARGGFESRSDTRGLTEMHLLDAQLLLDQNDPNAALAVLAPLTGQIGNREQQAAWHLRRAEALLRLDDRDAARAAALQAVTDADLAHSAQVRVEALLVGARASKAVPAADLLQRARNELKQFASANLSAKLYLTSLALNAGACADDFRLGETLFSRVSLISERRAFFEAARACRRLTADEQQRAAHEAQTPSAAPTKAPDA